MLIYMIYIHFKFIYIYIHFIFISHDSLIPKFLLLLNQLYIAQLKLN